MIKVRLNVGQRKYGHEIVENDGRNFTTEALEEALDCAVYLAAKLIEIQGIRYENELYKLDLDEEEIINNE